LLPERVTLSPILLRPFTASDAPRIELLAGDWEVASMTALIPHPYLPGMAEAWLAEQRRDREAGRIHTYAITRVTDAVLVGAIDLRIGAGGSDSFGYWVGRPYWGRGYATAALRALIALAFTYLDVEELQARHLVRNPASGQVMAKCGLRLLHREIRDHRGAPDEFYVRGITREAWERVVAAD